MHSAYTRCCGTRGRERALSANCNPPYLLQVKRMHGLQPVIAVPKLHLLMPPSGFSTSITSLSRSQTCQVHDMSVVVLFRLSPGLQRPRRLRAGRVLVQAAASQTADAEQPAPLLRLGLLSITRPEALRLWLPALAAVCLHRTLDGKGVFFSIMQVPLPGHMVQNLSGNSCDTILQTGPSFRQH